MSRLWCHPHDLLQLGPLRGPAWRSPNGGAKARSPPVVFVHGRQIFVRRQGPISEPQTRPNFQGHLDGPLPCDVPWRYQLHSVNCARLRARVRRFKMCTPRQHWTQSSIRVQARFLGRSPVRVCLHLPNAASSNGTLHQAISGIWIRDGSLANFLNRSSDIAVCNSRSRAHIFLLKKGSGFGPFFGAKNGTENWVQKLTRFGTS